MVVSSLSSTRLSSSGSAARASEALIEVMTQIVGRVPGYMIGDIARAALVLTQFEYGYIT
jgi:hypothetical protein